jgi:protein-S-isoprenylcysteine O-methyltransferase Ste14
MTSEVAHRRGWQIFEVVFGVPLLAALALQAVIPLSFSLGGFAPVGAFGGGILAVAGVVLVALTRRQLAQFGQPTDPGRPTSRLVTTGVYGVSRNPLYLGGIVVLAGGALALDLPWVWVLLVPAVIGCHVILVAPEERYLAARFGDEYRAYAARVCRWIGRVGANPRTG